MSESYRVLGITSESRILKVAREDFWNNKCPTRFANGALHFTFFNYASTVQNVTLYYGCTINNIPSIPIFGQSSAFYCTINSTTLNAFYTTRPIPSNDNLWKCNNNVVVPVFQTAASALEKNATTLVEALDGGFELEWTFLQMDPHFSRSPLFFLIIIISIFKSLPVSFCENDGRYTNCTRTFECGNIETSVILSGEITGRSTVACRSLSSGARMVHRRWRSCHSNTTFWVSIKPKKF
ncbi:hypothetical protein HHK36_006920 [Tetracentron sinense]|uniref:Uncharacterized protein n=1 Tax=Tetracentron sinense TaxID=13715 RepID=A0A834ZIC6_TETSI|nr:hypothetical protein HHK36_006920 [Tetracentron sinense]